MILNIYVDSVLIGEGEYNTALNPSEGFFLGQAPWVTQNMEYWPYGPHAMMGTYGHLKIYDEAIMN